MNALTLFLTKNSLRVEAKRKLRFDYTVMILGIVISVTVVASAINLFEGYQKTLKQILLDSNAHILIYPDFSASFSEETSNAALIKLKSLPEIKDIQPVFSSTAMVQSGGKVRSCLIKAYEDNSQTKWFNRYIRYGSSNLNPGNLIVGEKLMDDLKVTVGDKITLIHPLSDSYSPLQSVTSEKDFTVEGVIKTGYYEMDKSLIIMPIQDAYEFYGTRPQVSYLEITLQDNMVDKAQNLASDYRLKLGHSYTTSSWIDFNGNLFSLIEVEKWLIFLVFSFLIMIAALNCVSIVSTSIIDRKREIAILRTIGVTQKQVKAIVFFRILSISTISIILGLILGTFTSWLITKQSLYNLKGDVYFIDKINMSVSILNYGVLFILSLALIIVCIRLPLKHLNKLEIVEILRGR